MDMDKKHTCPTCGKGFARADHLRNHLTIHKEERPFCCDHPGCTLSFKLQLQLRTHQHTHSDSYPFCCDYEGCGLKFKQKRYLVGHAKVHSQERPHKCTYPGCAQTFARKDTLASHLRTHTQERPYRCQSTGCTQAFKTRGHLNTHVRGHNNDRPYKCQFEGCEKAFLESGALVAHSRCHTGERPFVCNHPGCDQAYAQKSNLTAHQQRHSPEAQLRQKKEEQKISLALKEAGVEFSREHYISFDCWQGTYASADFLIVTKERVVIVEVDEHQHEGYAQVCEVSRMSNIYAAFTMEGNTLPVLFIRYNPHAFRINNECIRVPTKSRQERLIDAINTPLATTDSGMQVLYMFYDCDLLDQRPTLKIWDDEYTSNVRQCCLPPIVR